jgi:hypothetical protein
VNGLFSQLLRGNESAVALCLLVFDWANDYDHLVDGDLPEADREAVLHRAMWTLLGGMQTNDFYRQYQDELLVTLANGVSTWRTSTLLQRGTNPKGHELAHVMRWAPVEFFIHCARIVGGEAWVQEVAPGFWLAMTQDHSFEQFARECGG